MSLHDRSPYPFHNELYFRGSMVWIGRFECHHTHAQFDGEHLYQGHHMVIFPRTQLELTILGRAKLISSPNLAVFYNNGMVYKRGYLTEQGDRNDNFQFRQTLLTEILATYDPDVRCREHPFKFTHTFVSRENFVRQRRLAAAALQHNQPDSLWVDEMGIELLEALVADSFHQRGIRPKLKQTTDKTHRQLAFEAQRLLATRYDEHLTLKTISTELYVSPYHLSRVFRQQTGSTLHNFLAQLRLRIARDRISDYANNITRLALDVGYATHSHFTEAFHRNFGYPPSQFVHITS